MEGDWINYKPGDDGNRKLIIDTIETGEREAEIIRRKDIPEYFTPNIKAVINQYWKCSRYGFPYMGGWAEQPCIAMDIIWALDNEKSLIQRRSRDGS